MTLFNHSIEYVTRSSNGSREFYHDQTVVTLSYDNGFGERVTRQLVFDIDIKYVKIGGTCSTNVQVLHGVVMEPKTQMTDYCAVLANNTIYQCLSGRDNMFPIGDSVRVFEHWNQQEQKFDWMITKKEIINPDWCSLNVLAFNEDNEQLEIVTIDPYFGSEGTAGRRSEIS